MDRIHIRPPVNQTIVKEGIATPDFVRYLLNLEKYIKQLEERIKTLETS